MATKTITWPDGTTAVLTYSGQGSGPITVQSDPNNHYEARSAQVTVKTTDGSNIQRTVTIQQAAKVRTDISNAVVTAANQTYSGTAKTPTPTVTLNGVTIPSSGYDVAYSNNTNAGTATITVTGKGDYTGTATGTFTIAKASRTLSFADAYVVLAPSGNITKTATPSAGSGDGAITYSISSTTYATINSSSGKVTSKTSDGSAVVTATIAEGTNYLGATASYNLYVFATTHNFAYTGSVQNITLPPGSYKLQCWGAQGGSNAADTTYGITAQAGGKGGYSEGVLTVAEQLTLYAFVGGQGGSSGNGGWNCGGGSSGSIIYTSGDDVYTSRMGCGGGSTDFALVTSSMSYSSRRNNRSAASLLSRIIVAGGGSGGAMYYRKRVTSSQQYVSVGSLHFTDSGTINGNTLTKLDGISGSNYYSRLVSAKGVNVIAAGTQVKVDFPSSVLFSVYWSDNTNISTVKSGSTASSFTFTMTQCPGSNYALRFQVRQAGSYYNGTATVYEEQTVQTPVETTFNQTGYVGGGTTGDGYSSATEDFRGGQNEAGISGGFGLGANQSAGSGSAYASAAGGAGWYGGGSANTTNTASNGRVKCSGGGSGFVNTAANAQYRPSGYTGIELDSGTTTIGTSSFPSTNGGTETGHSGNGYAKITRLS